MPPKNKKGGKGKPNQDQQGRPNQGNQNSQQHQGGTNPRQQQGHQQGGQQGANRQADPPRQQPPPTAPVQASRPPGNPWGRPLPEAQVVTQQMGNLNISTGPPLVPIQPQQSSAWGPQRQTQVSQVVTPQGSTPTGPMSPRATSTEPMTPSTPSSGPMSPVPSQATGSTHEMGSSSGSRASSQLSEPSKVQSSSAVVPLNNKQLLWTSKFKGSFSNPYDTSAERKAKVGKEGRPIKLLTNHFPLSVKGSSIYRYDIQFTFPKWKRQPRKKDSDITIRAFEALKKKNANTVFKNSAGAVYDGSKNIYSPSLLNLGGRGSVFSDSVEVREVADIPELMVTLDAKIQYITTLEVSDVIRDYELRGSKAEKPQDLITALNIILGYSSRLVYDCINRSIFPHTEGSVIDLASGKALWIGTFTSVRMGWTIRLNVDMANKPAYEQGSLLDFIGKFLGARDMKDILVKLSKPYSFEEVSKELRGLKVRFNRPDNQVRDYGVNGLKPGNAKNTFFPHDEPSGKTIKVSVFDYFKAQYKCTLQFHDLPVVHVGNKNKFIYLPIERLSLKRQACPQAKRLKDRETADMIKHTAKPPMERAKGIMSNLKALHNGFSTDPYALAFKLSVVSKMTEIGGRVLDPPVLGYKKNIDDKLTTGEVRPNNGKWNAPRMMFHDGKRLDYWGLLDLTNMNDNMKDELVDKLYNIGSAKNLTIDYPIRMNCDDRNLEKGLTSLFKELKDKIKEKEPDGKKDRKPDLIMIVVNFKDSNIYGRIKTMGDIVFGIPTQVVLRNNVNKMSEQTLYNICLKLNSKLGGTNQTIHQISRPPILNRPVMFLGADVTHAPPSDLGFKPSIAAVVASCDAKAAIYNTVISVQPRMQNALAVEMILKLEDIVFDLLMKFFDKNGGRKPEKIVYFRDGVSEGQFEEVLLTEISAIQRACKRLQAEGYEPGITFLVVQKRHNTRLFPANPKEGVGKMQNVPPGTVVDTEITHPTETSYFLASHEGIQGTTKPTCYHLLYDDNGLTSDELQKLSFYLCHLYSRCERSVSYPAPTYYAHLAAFRARYHHNILCDQGKAEDPSEIEKMEHFEIPNYFV